MKTKQRIQRICCAAALSTAFLLALAPAGKAATLTYTVTLNNLSYLTDPTAGYALDFDLLTGSGNGSGGGNVTNTVTLSNFVFTGGSAIPGATFTQGGETGSLASSVVLTNSAANNEYTQGFTAPLTSISFQVAETLNTEVVTEGTPTPDQFTVYIDDNNTADGLAATTDPSGNDTLVSSSLVSGDTISSVKEFAVVPEPGSTAMLCIGGGILAFVLRRRNSKVSA